MDALWKCIYENISNKEISIVCVQRVGGQSEKGQGERLRQKREAEDRRHPCLLLCVSGDSATWDKPSLLLLVQVQGTGG